MGAMLRELKWNGLHFLESLQSGSKGMITGGGTMTLDHANQLVNTILNVQVLDRMGGQRLQIVKPTEITMTSSIAARATSSGRAEPKKKRGRATLASTVLSLSRIREEDI